MPLEPQSGQMLSLTMDAMFVLNEGLLSSSSDEQGAAADMVAVGK